MDGHVHVPERPEEVLCGVHIIARQRVVLAVDHNIQVVEGTDAACAEGIEQALDGRPGCSAGPARLRSFRSD